MRIAIDTGGTFTDCVYCSTQGLKVLKVPSTAADPGRAVLTAIAQIGGGDSYEVRHGTTVGTNALLERKGARVAFVTTSGFEDILAIGRQSRPKLYKLLFSKEPPLAGEGMRFGIGERTAADGSVLRAADEVELGRLGQTIKESGAEAIAISLLFSFADPTNEKTVSDSLRKLGLPVSVSHELLPEFREYERGSTVVINAYLAPVMQAYLDGLDQSLRSTGSRLHVMQSSGGIISASMASREPVRTILSGPAGGVVGAMAVAKMAGFKRIMTFDMGGTSTDVALMDSDKGLHITSGSQIAGMPVAVPMLDIHTVGAGGGSCAGFDRGGALTVGPQSAGSDPGPICYGRGEQPTVTDANLILGRLDADGFLGGGMKLQADRARDYLTRRMGKLSDVETFAEGIIRLADTHMEKALRKISVERGHDPRDFTLVSFGGAGPLHACALARFLRIPRVLVPPMAGALSAYGILASDAVRDYSRTVMLSPDDPRLPSYFEALEELGRAEMEAEGWTALAMRTVDLRYAGQGYELNVNWSGDPTSEFHRLHEIRYGYADTGRVVEAVTIRVRFVASTDPIPMPRREPRAGDGRSAVIKQGSVRFEGERQQASVYHREQLVPGDMFAGPALILEYSATTFLPPGCCLQVDDYSNLVIEVGQ